MSKEILDLTICTVDIFIHRYYFSVKFQYMIFNFNFVKNEGFEIQKNGSKKGRILFTVSAYENHLFALFYIIKIRAKKKIKIFYDLELSQENILQKLCSNQPYNICLTSVEI